tara:strand:+ start:24 stop:422 length:399 start_codon:yes stop_codon:yes gene_type:complete
MDAITNKDTPPTFPLDDATFNRTLLPDRHLSKLTKHEFYAYTSKQQSVQFERFTKLKMRENINEICMDVGDKITPGDMERRLFGEHSPTTPEKCKAMSINGKRCTHNAKPGCEGYCLKHYKVHVASKYVKIN